MPIFDGNLPYTNLHELNLDWIVKIVKELQGKTDLIDEAVNTVENYADIISELFVTPDMYGAVGDGVTDDYNAFTEALQHSKYLLIPPKTYYLGNSLLLEKDNVLVGINRFESVLLFSTNTNGIRLNHSNVLNNFTVKINGNASALFVNTQYNYSFNMGTLCSNMNIENISSSVEGNSIKLEAYNIANVGTNGAYNMTFKDIKIWGKFKYAIEILNNVLTTSKDETYFTGINFEDIFVQSAETVIISHWNDLTNGNVPITGNASCNGNIKLTRVNAQYTSGVTKQFAIIHNCTSITFDNCTTFDYYHLRYDLSIPYYVFNAYNKMSTAFILLNDEIDIENVQPYISFINATTYWTDFNNVIISLTSSGGTHSGVRSNIKPYLETSAITNLNQNINLTAYVNVLDKRAEICQCTFFVAFDADTANQYYTIGTLPAGYRPKTTVQKRIDAIYPYLVLNTDGTVQVYVSTTGRQNLYVSECFVCKVI